MKRFFAFLLALLACAALLCVMVGAEDVPANVNWEEVSSEAELRALGSGTHYAKVTGNITLENDAYFIINGTLTLDLNGHTITYAPPAEKCVGQSVFRCEDNANFTLMDSKGGGKITFAHLGETYTGTGTEAGETPYSRAYAVGVRKNSTFTMKGGTIENFGNTSDFGATVYVNPLNASNHPSFNMEGGVIQNCQTNPSQGSGAAVWARGTNATVNISGGTIQNCNAGNNGGAIYACGARVNITGGQILNCSAQSGGAIYAENYSSTTTDTAQGPSNVTISGSAKISGNRAGTYGKGGAIYAEDSTITMMGGTISANRASNGGHEVYLASTSKQTPCSFTMSGGKIEHTTAASGTPALASFYINSNSELSISGGEITLGGERFAFSLVDSAKLTATGGTIIASGTERAFNPGKSSTVGPKKAATYAGEDSEKAEFVTYPNLVTYANNKYIKLVPGWTLTLNNKGHGEDPKPVIVPKDTGVKIPDLTDSDSKFVFTGWYRDRACTQAYNAQEAITADTTLYAGWVQSDAFGLSFSGERLSLNTNGVWYMEPDPVTYGTAEWWKSLTLPFTITNIGAVALNVELENKSGGGINALYFELNDTYPRYTKTAVLKPGESKTVYMELESLFWSVGTIVTTNPHKITVKDFTDATHKQEYQVGLKWQRNQATAHLDTPTLNSGGYPYGTTLGEIKLPDGWSWVADNGTRLPAETYAVYARYTLSDDEKKYYDWAKVDGYNAEAGTVTRILDLKITQGDAPTLLFHFMPPAGLIYDGNEKAATVIALKTPAGYEQYKGTFTVLYNGSETPPTDAGTYAVSISGSSDGNYKAFTGLRDESWRFTISHAPITPPKAVTGLVYNGETQTGVVLPEGAPYTLTGNTAKNAGSYTATAKLTDKKNYVWSDGTTDDKTIEWSIAKAAPGEITVLIENFTRSRDIPTPALSANPGNAAVHFYYTTEKRNSGGTLWTADAAKRLTDGTYYIYAELDETENYLAYTTAPTPFTIYSLSTGEHIRVTEPKNGRILAPSDALPGSTVTVIVKPDDGYILGSLRVTDESGKRVSLTKEADGSYSFIMPRSAAYIEAEFVSSNPFVDVPASAWYAGAVRDAWANGLIDGVNATHFDPDGSLTVAQAIKLAAALHQRIEDGEVTLKNGRPWYRSYLEYAVEHGVIEEAYLDYSDAALNAPVQRAEFAHILYGAANPYTAINEIASDAIPDVQRGDRYADEIYTFYRAGVLNGSDRDGTFHPTSLIRRCEAAAILIRAFDESARMTVSLQ